MILPFRRCHPTLLQVSQSSGDLGDGDTLLPVQIRLAHRQPPGYIAHPQTTDKLQFQYVVQQPFGGRHPALASGSKALDGLVQDLAQCLCWTAALFAGSLAHNTQA